MICILSMAVLDTTTELVIDWLKAWQVPYVRLNVEDLRTGALAIRIEQFGTTLSLQAGGASMDPVRIQAVWFRRWGSYHQPIVERQRLFTDGTDGNWQINTVSTALHFQRELRTTSGLLFDLLSHARWLGRPETSSLNKLRVLKLAAEAGLNIPVSLLSTDRSLLKLFLEEQGNVVTKAVSEPLRSVLGGRSFVTYTSAVEQQLLEENRGDRIFPSLLQERLEKQYEVRAFYLDGRFYSMAIFSQADQQTSIDFRRYRYQRPNRTVPYQLPNDVTSKLAALFKKLDLETGSADLVRTLKGDHVFLEINPIGQFGMVSHPCNYHLEHAVASALVKRMGEAVEQ